MGRTHLLRASPALLAAWLGGCASTAITLRHEVSPPAKAAHDPARAPAVRVSAKDARPQAAADGGLDVGTAPDPFENGPAVPGYTLAEPVATTFSRALAAELEARGFRIDDGAQVVARVDVRRFYSEGRKVGVLSVVDVAAADLEMEVTVAAAGGATRYRRRIEMHAETPVGLVGLTRTGSVQTSLQRAMDEGFAVLLGDAAFLRALSDEPGAGAAADAATPARGR